MSALPYIAHFDLDSFFVSVEMVLNPELKGKPVILGGRERGIVTTCSYEARKYGVHSGMPGRKASELCPHGIFLKGNYSAYGKYSRWVTDIIAESVPVYEKASIDEFYIDLTGMDTFFNPLEFTINLREKIMHETGLPISFGLASNKLVAKIATNQAKPNGYLHILHGHEAAFLHPLNAEEIPGVGKSTLPILHGLGIKTIGDIAHAELNVLEEFLGKWGLDLIQKANGKKGSIYFSGEPESKSISAETTFEDSNDINELHKKLVRLTEKVCSQLRESDLRAGCVAIKIRYNNFETFTRQATIPDTYADDEIIPVVKALFNKYYQSNRKLRLVGVKISQITDRAQQGNLFEDSLKKKGLYQAIDSVNKRFGKFSVKRASGK